VIPRPRSIPLLSVASVLLVLALLVLATGCSSHKQPPKDALPQPVIATSQQELYQHFDSEVIVTGIAVSSANEGVAVAIADGTHIVIPEMSSWPQQVIGKKVTVTGVLNRVPAPTGQRPKPEVRFVLQAVRWKAGHLPATRP